MAIEAYGLGPSVGVSQGGSGLATGVCWQRERERESSLYSSLLVCQEVL